MKVVDGEDAVLATPSASADLPQLRGQKRCPMAVRDYILVMGLYGAVRDDELLPPDRPSSYALASVNLSSQPTETSSM